MSTNDPSSILTTKCEFVWGVPDKGPPQNAILALFRPFKAFFKLAPEVKIDGEYFFIHYVFFLFFNFLFLNSKKTCIKCPLLGSPTVHILSRFISAYLALSTNLSTHLLKNLSINSFIYQFIYLFCKKNTVQERIRSKSADL